MRAAVVVVLALASALVCVDATPVSDDDAASWNPIPFLHNYGNAAVSQVEIIPVFWSSNASSSALRNCLTNFYCELSQSNYFDALAQYGVGHGNSNCHSKYILSGTSHASTLTDNDIRSTLVNKIKCGALPAPTKNTYYAVHLPKDVQFNGGVFGLQCNDNPESGSGPTGECGYHASWRHYEFNYKIRYGVLGDYRSGSICASTCTIDYESSVDTSTFWASHILSEAVTDPDNTGADISTQTTTVGWYEPNYGGVADICETSHQRRHGWITLDGTNFTVARIWSNYQGSCVTSYVPPTTEYVTHGRITPKTHTTTTTTTVTRAPTSPATTAPAPTGSRRPRLARNGPGRSRARN